ncbi:hypothetical protein GCM10010517_44090 [Streptosporangium fragile]|uniref:Tissue inhibitor of metalloproteinase n=1 Tax=Streptosporangium fragile TaxID=46186 RepID=A0ABN3W150_9ACTN
MAVLLLLTAALAVTPGTACACDCIFPAPAKQMREAEAVFTGTAVAARRPERDPFGPIPPVVYTFRVDHVYKGPPSAEFEVATPVEEAGCGRRFDTGSRYLVFAEQGAMGSGLFAADPGVPLYTSLCLSNRRVRPGDGPLRKEDGFQDVEALTDDLLAALRTGAAPRATAATTRPGASGAEPAPLWVYGVTAVAVTGLALAGWRHSGRSRR